jgi:hypothetical protein
VEHDALVARFIRLEADVKKLETEAEGREKDRTSMRNGVYLGVISAGLSLIVAIVVAVVK